MSNARITDVGDLRAGETDPLQLDDPSPTIDVVVIL